MDNTYFLEVMTAHGTSRYPYETKADADAAMAEIEPKLGNNSYNYRNDPESNRHRLTSPSGDAIIVLSTVYSVRVLDEKEYVRLTEFVQNVQVKQASAINSTMIPVMAALMAKEKLAY